jgi:hypothetical protein
MLPKSSRSSPARKSGSGSLEMEITDETHWADVFAANGTLTSYLEHDSEKWEPVFGKGSCSNRKLDHDPDST